ncbi:amino acid adenylation domain-containing protein [Streptomyces griseofuscus]|uniref:amino acid adenylation domain-containing protein n=1 Tax=Streptomyces TaxID=1883 RepID=UPI0018F0BD8D|nr:non-ribosomal peptide synthetase [Streptomyces sp. CRPSP2-6A1]MBJ7005463.1 amino acid adenylation domain-containing protein [Streptomyces sp. CRPSP2-6A1]
MQGEGTVAGEIPLSYAQLALWFNDRLQQGDASYNMPVALRLRGPLDIEVLRAALADVIGRHGALRTVFPDRDGTPYQRILDARDVETPLSVVPADEAALPGLIAAASRECFDLATEIPLRLRVFALGPQDHLVLLVQHHIAGDGWSMAPLARDLNTAYLARLAGQAPDWPPLAADFAEHAVAQHRSLGSLDDPDSGISAQLAYWKEALAGIPDCLPLPTDRPRPPVMSHEGDYFPWEIPAGLHRDLLALARTCRVSLFMVVQAALATVLSRSGAGDDIPLASPTAGRGDSRYDDVVGYFVNPLVLRIDTSGDPTFRELLKRVRRTDLQGFTHQDMPIERLITALNPPRSLAWHPLFQVMLAFQNLPEATLQLPGVDCEVVEADPGGAKFDLSFNVMERKDAEGAPAGLTCFVEYSSDLFERAGAEDFTRRLVLFLERVAQDPDLRLGDIDLLTDDDRRALTARWEGPATEVPALAYHRAFEERAAADPDAPALVAADARLTFGELDARANRLARELVERGAAPETPVLVLLDRTADLVVALLAVLKSGAVFAPLTPDTPAERLAAVAANLRPVCAVTTTDTAPRLPADTPALVLDDPGTRERIAARPATGLTDADRAAPGRPEDTAYVIHTSGSTGTPKGVAVTHDALTHLAHHHRSRMARRYAPDGTPRLQLGLVASITFDTAWEPFFWLLEGHCLHLLPDEVRLDPEALVAEVRRERLDFLDLTPTYAQALLTAGLLAEGHHRPRVLMLGGEGVGPELWSRLAAVEGTAVHNYYGPTEFTVDALTCELGDSPVPVIGRPLDNVRAAVLDERLRPVPLGVPGELYLAGPQLARGYVGSPALTAERFVADPYGPPGSRMYRTGDLARLLRDGQVEYLGRADDQVKIRGFRIEPGEIEAVLARHPGVAQAAVAVRGEDSGDPHLAAYVVPAAGTRPPGAAELHDHLADHLPSYMLPAAYAHLDRLPLTSSGKLDRRALPEPDLRVTDDAGRPPADEREAALCALFAEVLRADQVGPDDDFFRLGGHSLLAMRLVSRVRAATGAELPIRAVFESRTPARLARLLGATEQRPALVPAERPAETPLSHAQRRLWFLQRLETESPAYHIPLPLRLDGPLDIGALGAALHDVVVRHEALRTVFPDRDGVPHQRVLDVAELPSLLDIAPLDPARAEGEALAAELRAAASVPFDLVNRPPLRARLYLLGPGRHVLLLTVHHIACDGWSLQPLAADLASAYRARAEGRAPDWSPLPVQYADYTLWQHRLLGDVRTPGTLAAGQWEYWRTALTGLPDEVPLPVDRRRTPETGHEGGTVPVRVEAATHRALADLARSGGASLFMAVQAALAALLTRLGAGTDIPLGTPVAGRTDARLEDLVGFFVNTLVLRTDTGGDPTFRELLERVRERDVADYAHQDLPFEQLVDLVNPERQPGRHPLFQVALVVDQGDGVRLDIPGVTAERITVQLAPAKFDLTVTLAAERAEDGTEGPLTGTVEYRTDLFDQAGAAALADRLTRLLTAVAADPDQPIGRIALLSEDERRLILDKWNDTRHELEPTTLADCVAEQIARTPEATALVFEGEEVTFGALDTRIDALAARLSAHGVGRGDTVAVAVPRSVELIVAVCAAHRAGAAYVPLDSDYPADRLAYMLENSRPTAVVATPGEAARLRVPEGVPLLLPSGEDTADPGTAGRTAPDARAVPADPAYVIYTSGSTGRPKGVVVPHRAVTNRLRWGQDQYLLTAEDRVLHKTPSSFDVSVWEIFWPLSTGATLVVARPEGHRDPGYLCELIREQRVTVAQFVPSMLDAFLQHPDAGLCDSLRLVIVGGEALSTATARRFHQVLPGIRLVDQYGPTEAAIEVTAWTCRPQDDDGRPVPIGRPVWNTRVHILDAELQIAPPGVAGELYLDGAQLADGYLGRPALTAERFVANPYGPPGSRMYRTGDIARWRADGAVEYLGRVDGQVKVRGFRIELGEIEAALSDHPAVAAGVVLVREDRHGAPRIVAYVVPVGEGPEPTAGELREHLRARLPEHMVPTGYVTLDVLPVTPNGKLDRAALPEPAAVPDAAERSAREPATPLERTLTALVAEVLEVPGAGPDDDFFLLGGHSLMMVRLVERIRAETGVQLAVRTLFDHPTAAGLAARIAEDPGLDDRFTRRRPAWEPVLPLRAHGSRTPLFCVHPVVGDGFGYVGLLRGLGPEQPVYALQGAGPLGNGPRPATLAGLAAEYLARIRQIQPQGPYRLLGWSFGGVLVHEMAVQLREAGERIELLALMDSVPPREHDRRAPDDPVTEKDVVLGLLDGVGVPAADIAAVRDGSRVPEPAELLRLIAPALGASTPEDPAGLAAMVDACRYHGELMIRWTPRVFDGGLLAFTATAEARRAAETGGASTAELWAPYLTGEVTDHPMAARHLELVEPGHIDFIGRVLAAELDRLEER